MANDSNQIPSWLKNLQENSWELELLISGGAIFSLFQLSDLFLDFVFTIRMTSHIPGTGFFIILGMLGIKLLTTGFAIHLILRAFWLGMVCVNYAFPKGISSQSFSPKPPYKGARTEGNLKKEIIGVDNLSGLVMYATILVSFVLIGAIIAFLILLTLPVTLFHAPDMYLTAMAFVGLAYYIDYISFGLLRKIPYLSYVTFPVFKVFDILSLRPFYGKSLTLFATNVHKGKAVLGFVGMMVLAGFFTYASIYRVMHWPNILDSREFRRQMAPETNWQSHGQYLDILHEDGIKVHGPCIQSEIIKSNFLKVFIPYDVDFEQGIHPDSTLSAYVMTTIDDSVYRHVKWYNYWAKDIDQIGLRAHIDIAHLERGEHVIRLKSTASEEFSSSIVFWKDKSAIAENNHQIDF